MSKNSNARKSAIRISQEHVCSKEENLNRLLKTGILQSFVEENNGEWDHRKWLELCDRINEKGFTPIDLDQVGLMLEEVKSRYPKI